MNNRLNNVKESSQNLKSQLEGVRKSIEAERNARPETVGTIFSTFRRCYDCSTQAERKAELSELAAAKEKLTELEKELSQYGSCDPVKIEAKRRAVTLANEAALRWTGRFYFTDHTIAPMVIMLSPDNVALVMSYFSRQHGVDIADIRKYLDIGDDFEDLA